MKTRSKPTAPVTPTIGLEGSFDPCALIDSSGNILWSNPAWLAAFSAEHGSLSAIFSEAFCTTVLDTVHSRELLVEPHHLLAPTNLRRTLCIIDIGGENAPAGLLLLALFASEHSAAPSNSDGELLATIAHDMKNPIGAVLGYADTLLSTPVGTGVPEKPRHIIARIRTAATRALELIRNYHHLSKLRTPSKLTSRYAQCGLHALIRDTLDQLLHDHSEQAPVELQLAPGEIVINMDRSSAERVVANLASNALQYTPKEGAIRVSTERSEHQALLTIANSTALPTSELATLFRPFESSTDRFPRSVPGTGLGLYIVQQLVQRARGTVQVSSSAETGTTIQVRLPLGEESTAGSKK